MPTHWLPFVLTSRVQQWNRPKTIAITALAGTGHVLVTALLGFFITWFGTSLSKTVSDWFPRIAGGALLLFGLYYLVRQISGRGHVHFGYPHEHLHEADGPEHHHHDEHEHEHEGPPVRTSDRTAILSLLAFLTFSPCEGFLPIYVSGIRYGWKGFALLTGILSFGTVAGMVVFTSLTLAGLGKVKLGVLEKYESALMAVLLCLIGVLILVFER
jgi:nickel/cobalt transporter (NicO) family protein